MASFSMLETGWPHRCLIAAKIFASIMSQGRAPKPTSDDVHIASIPKMTAYVVQFGGFATEESLLKKASELAAAAKVTGLLGGSAELHPAAALIAACISHDLCVCAAVSCSRLFTFCDRCLVQADGTELKTDGFFWAG